MNPRAYWEALTQAAREFMSDKAMRLSAALAYYSVFSMAPLLLIAIAVAGTVLGEDAVRGQLGNELKNTLGPSGASAVQEMVVHARRPDTNIIVSSAGIVMLLVGACGFFVQLQDALNTVWGVEPKPGRGWRGILKDRFLSFSIVLGTGFLLLVSMVVTTMLQAMSSYGERVAHLPPQLWAVAIALVSFALIALMFAAIFKVLPDVRVPWRHVWVGAGFTAALFVAGKFALGCYLGREATASSYGSAGALIVVLVWVYYSSIILLFGAEFTQVWASRHGFAIVPTNGSVKSDDNPDGGPPSKSSKGPRHPLGSLF
ncbi:MAG: YihY/virulence factor BrkB family protein [Verrucomicrobiota bacterium]